MDISETSLSKGLEKILTHTRVSQACLGDLIHDGKKTNENIELLEKKYEFWGEVELILKTCIEKIEKAYERIVEK